MARDSVCYRPTLLRTACLTAVWLLAFADAAADSAAIQAEIARHAEIAGGETGVAAWMLDREGPRVLFNADQPFPMASVYKVAIAGAVLASIDERKLSLDQMIAIDRANFVPSDVIATKLIHPGISLSVQNLLELMLTESDNTATDLLMDLAGGPQAVTRWVQKQGVTGLRVDRDTDRLLRDFFGLPDGPLEEVYVEAVRKDPGLEAIGSLPNPRYDEDPRDSSTPVAMGELLAGIFDAKTLSPASTKLLVGMMERCKTGTGRLVGRLPAGTIVAHKTGTLGGTVNDAGVIYLPDDGGRLVIVVFIKKSDRPEADRERAIAEIARSVRDYFLLQD
jgi:beta-lactamase class A